MCNEVDPVQIADRSRGAIGSIEVPTVFGLVRFLFRLELAEHDEHFARARLAQVPRVRSDGQGGQDRNDRDDDGTIRSGTVRR